MVTMAISCTIGCTAPGIIRGGSLRFAMRKLNVRALPKDLPDFIDADISKLDIGDKLYVTEMKNKNSLF